MGQATVSLIASVVLGLVSAGLAAALFQILKQQGRLLLRLEQVEGYLGMDAGGSIDRGTVSLQARSPAGLRAGTVFPDFRLNDLDGKATALGDLRGQPVLLVHWSARCSFCDLVAPDLAKLEPGLETAGVRLLLVSSGAEEAERKAAGEHGLKSTILLQNGANRIEALASLGTPSAYLLDEEGRVARPLAVGADQVLALAEELVPRAAGKKRRLPGERPLSESRLERNGLRSGTPAPLFTLPEIQGGTLSLDRHRGKKVFLIFSDPHCGPCDQLAPHLVRLHEKHRGNGLDLLLVGRGDFEENRRKARQNGFEFPVVLQKKWEVSRQYGIFSTPVAFLIDENGTIEADVARGVDEILALAAQASSAGKEVAHG